MAREWQLFSSAWEFLLLPAFDPRVGALRSWCSADSQDGVPRLAGLFECVIKTPTDALMHFQRALASCMVLFVVMCTGYIVTNFDFEFDTDARCTSRSEAHVRELFYYGMLVSSFLVAVLVTVLFRCMTTSATTAAFLARYYFTTYYHNSAIAVSWAVTATLSAVRMATGSGLASGSNTVAYDGFIDAMGLMVGTLALFLLGPLFDLAQVLVRWPSIARASIATTVALCVTLWLVMRIAYSDCSSNHANVPLRDQLMVSLSFYSSLIFYVSIAAAQLRKLLSPTLPMGVEARRPYVSVLLSNSKAAEPVSVLSVYYNLYEFLVLPSTASIEDFAGSAAEGSGDGRAIRETSRFATFSIRNHHLPRLDATVHIFMALAGFTSTLVTASTIVAIFGSANVPLRCFETSKFATYGFEPTFFIVLNSVSFSGMIFTLLCRMLWTIPRFPRVFLAYVLRYARRRPFFLLALASDITMAVMRPRGTERVSVAVIVAIPFLTLADLGLIVFTSRKSQIIGRCGMTMFLVSLLSSYVLYTVVYNVACKKRQLELTDWIVAMIGDAVYASFIVVFMRCIVKKVVDISRPTIRLVPRPGSCYENSWSGDLGVAALDGTFPVSAVEHKKSISTRMSTALTL